MVRRQMLLAALAATSTALSTMRREAAQDDLRTIEVAPGVTQIVTEEKKWELLQVSDKKKTEKHGHILSPLCEF